MAPASSRARAMIVTGPGRSGRQREEKRCQANCRRGSRSAARQLAPPSVLISTPAIGKAPQAQPQISVSPCPSTACGAGATIADSGITAQTGRIPPSGAGSL